MDDFTQKLLERTRARREMLQQKMQEHTVTPQPRKRRPLSSQNSEEQPTTKMDNDVAANSPSKRTRTDLVEDDVLENVPQPQEDRASDLSDEKMKTGSQSASTVSVRMKKLMNQRKVWEAEEQGCDISYDNLPSPVRHETASRKPSAANSNNSLDSKGRKRRLDALAARVRGWEDDVAHHDPPKTPDTEDVVVHKKPPTGRPQQAIHAKPVDKVAPQQATAPAPKIAKSNSNELNLNSLAKFAMVGKVKGNEVPKKANPLPLIQAGSHSKTILQTKQQTITVSSSQHSDKIQTNPGQKSLQQRVVDLQRNGCKAEVITISSSSATEIMERARAERQKELQQLRNRKVYGITTTSHTDKETSVVDNLSQEESEDLVLSSMTAQEEIRKDAEIQDECVKPEKKKVAKNSEYISLIGRDEKDEIVPSVSIEEQADSNISMLSDIASETACEFSSIEIDRKEENEDEETLNDDEDVEDETDGGEKLSSSHRPMHRNTPKSCAGDSLLSESSYSDLESDLVTLSVAETISDDDENESEASKMIDDLFEGLLSDEEEYEDDDLTLPRSHSPLTLPNLTRRKSRKEIKTELSVRNQTCNEAEDTHIISQPSKFQRTCLPRSNSTESIVSLCQENDFQAYTISAYRTEKRQSIVKRFDKRVVRNEAAAAKASTMRRSEPAVPVMECISNYMEQVSRQQRVIQQASAALNCCYDADHGKGTITEVEAEKLLQLASEKRLALLAEIQRLKQNRSVQDEGIAIKPCPGSLVIAKIRLPLRTEYIFSIANKRDAGEIRNHYYFVLVRNGHHLFSTQLVSTLDDLSGDSLVFKDQFAIKNLSSDFKLVIEVYSLNHRTRADGIPLQDKSKGKLSGILHKGRSAEVKKMFAEVVSKTKSKVRKMKSKNLAASPLSWELQEESSLSLTPRKLRSKRSSHIPMSPGGPNAIRISNFSLIGSASITLNDVKEKKFTLSKVPFLSPITGQILSSFSCNFQSDLEQKGFLTMFDDVGGLGAWHRRWCVLRQGNLYSWTYPDDEQHKKPLITVQVRECISPAVTTVERIMCARPNTFELRTMRPCRRGDKQNLISQNTGSVITTKHWLSADTKEERIAWIECLNQTLVDVRAWDSEALQPFKQ